MYIDDKGEMRYKAVAPLVAKENGYLSRAVFKNITLSPRKLSCLHDLLPLALLPFSLSLSTAGKYSITVFNPHDRTACLPPQIITVAPAVMSQNELGAVFQDLEDMLKF